MKLNISAWHLVVLQLAIRNVCQAACVQPTNNDLDTQQFSIIRCESDFKKCIIECQNDNDDMLYVEKDKIVTKTSLFCVNDQWQFARGRSYECRRAKCPTVDVKILKRFARRRWIPLERNPTAGFHLYSYVEPEPTFRKKFSVIEGWTLVLNLDVPIPGAIVKRVVFFRVYNTPPPTPTLGCPIFSKMRFSAHGVFSSCWKLYFMTKYPI